MQERISFIEPNHVTMISTNVVDTTLGEGMVDIGSMTEEFNSLKLVLTKAQATLLGLPFDEIESKIKLVNLTFKRETNKLLHIVVTGGSKQGTKVTYYYRPLLNENNFLVNMDKYFNDDGSIIKVPLPNCKAINLEMLKREIQKTDGIYELFGTALPYFIDMLYKKGDTVFTYDFASEKIVKAFEMKKDSSWKTNAKYKIIQLDTTIQTTDTNKNRISSIFDYGLFVSERRDTVKADGTTTAELVTYHRYGISDSDRLRKTYSITAGGVVIGADYTQVHNFDDIFLIENNIYYRFEKSKNSDFLGTKSLDDFFLNDKTPNVKYWEEIKLEKIFSKTKELNQNRCIDAGLDTRTFMPNGGKFVFKIEDCSYDLAALANFSTSKVSVKVLDANGNELESRYIVPSKIDDFVEWDFFKDCCNADFISCNRPIPSTRSILFKKEHDNRVSKIEVEFFGKSFLGNFFAGKTTPLPCVKANLTRRAAPAKEIEINNLSGLGVLREKEQTGFNLVETKISLKFDSHKERNRSLEMIESYISRLVFFNTTFYKNEELKNFTQNLVTLE